jgi:hypothetical protein
MILKIFKSQSPFVFFLLILFALLLWGDVFFFNESNFFIANNDNVLFRLCFNWLEKYKFISLFLSFILIVIQAVWLNSMVINTDITAKGTFIPGLIYVILMCSNYATLSFNGVVISGFFILFILKIVFSIYGKDDCYMDIFKISMIISIASLFYLPMILYVFFIWLILMVYRAFNFRIILISFVGFIIPYIYILFFYYWFDKTPILFQYLKNIYNSLFIHNIDFRIYLSTIPILLGCLYFISIIGLLRKTNSRVIKIRKYIYIITWMFFLTIIIVLFFSDSTLICLSLLSIPATFFVSDYFLSFKRKWIAELLFILVLIFVIVEKVSQIHQ